MITGPPAVGKMTVGQVLARELDYKLFHNHQSIDFTLQYFDWGTSDFKKLNEGIRQLMFATISESDLINGFIFTLVWAFDEKADWNYMAELENKFTKKGWGFYIVELYAPLDSRLERNVTDNRLLHKTSKRDVEKSARNLKNLDKMYQMNSESLLDGRPNFLYIDNTNLSVKQTVDLIVGHFNFQKI